MSLPQLYGHRESLQQWDEVEFIGVKELGVAVCVTVSPKKSKEVSSKRVPLNMAVQKSSNPFLGFKAIKMAEVR